jgi:spermidine synthase
VTDTANPSGRTLVLDQLRHAYVDLEDPNRLEFAYIRWFDAAVADHVEDRVDGYAALHIGGGGFSFPRHLAATNAASRHTILELDPVVFDTARSELGLVTSAALEVVLGDARLGIVRQPDDAFDVVVGDAFGSLSVPWHLTTDEFLAEVDRVLRPDGRYVMNIIDGPALSFVRAEARTLAARFEHVLVVSRPGSFAGVEGRAGGGGNVILVASHEPLDANALGARLERAGDRVRIVGAAGDLEAFIGEAPFLRDDFAPVDQLIGR